MSGLAVIYHRDGRPVDARRLAQMVQAMSHRGPEGMTHWTQGPIGLGHCLMHTTPESVKEEQPVSDGQRWLIWDGRLDNRDELLTRLNPATSAGHVGWIRDSAQTDPEIVLAAYHIWGTRCVEKIVGEFAFVLWDQATRTLFGARDRLGLKPFYYCLDGTTLLMASEAKPLLRVLPQMPNPDDEMILALLVSECREGDHHRSLFSGVHRLPPGHVMVVREGNLQITRYWQIDPTRQTIYKNPEEYVEHFLALFEEAVKCRVRSAFPVGCLLSGGLDSSAITWAAASHTAPVEAFTVFSDDPASDERVHARRVCDALGIPLWEFSSQSQDPLDGLEDVLWQVESPLVGTSRGVAAFRALVRSRHCRILLDGDAGDALLDEYGYLADLLARRGPVRFYRESRQFAQWVGEPLGEIAKVALGRSLPAPVKFWEKRVLRGIPPYWMNQDLARSLHLKARIRTPRVPLAFPFFCQAFVYAEIFNPGFVLKLELSERDAAWAGMEVRYPFLDSRLVEFVLSIPWHQRCRDGERKWLLRQAMKARLPEEVRLRRGKGDWTDGMDRALLALCLTDPPEPLADRSGMMGRYLNLRGAQRLVEQYRRGKRSLRWEVWSCVAFDRWLKRFWKDGGAHVRERTTVQEALRQTEAALLR